PARLKRGGLPIPSARVPARPSPSWLLALQYVLDGQYVGHGPTLGERPSPRPRDRRDRTPLRPGSTATRASASPCPVPGPAPAHVGHTPAPGGRQADGDDRRGCCRPKCGNSMLRRLPMTARSPGCGDSARPRLQAVPAARRCCPVQIELDRAARCLAPNPPLRSVFPPLADGWLPPPYPAHPESGPLTINTLYHCRSRP